MPVKELPSYRPSVLFQNKHINTIYPNLYRKSAIINYRRVRIKTPDDDFLDLDFSKVGSKTIVIQLHGLEGNSNSGCIRGMTQAINKNNWDTVVLNFRGCSGEPNKLFCSYYGGCSHDIDTVVKYILKQNRYDQIMLLGFSLGGNVLFKYLGEQGHLIPSQIKAAAGISVPCDLEASAVKLRKHINKLLYLNRLLKTLKAKLYHKIEAFPNTTISKNDIRRVRDFHDLDDLYTAPAHGYMDAEHYWQNCSSNQFIKNIHIPTLLINAQDDPFLGPECTPVMEARNNPNFMLEIPKSGGHVGFANNLSLTGNLWHETRVLEFFKENSSLNSILNLAAPSN